MKTLLKDEFPDIFKEIDVEKTKQEFPNIDLDKIAVNSHFQLYWICKDHPDHIYQTAVCNRTRKHTGCPYCSNQKVFPGFNDLQTRYPEIAKEWDYTKNYPITPDHVMPGTHTKYFWICPKGHSYSASPHNRTNRLSLCPECIHRKSTEELLIYDIILEKVDSTAISGKRFGKFEADILIVKYFLIIEYDGLYFHSSDIAKQRELEKNKLFKSYGYKLIRIKETKDSSLFFKKVQDEYCTVYYVPAIYRAMFFKNISYALNDLFSINIDSKYVKTMFNKRRANRNNI